MEETCVPPSPAAESGVPPRRTYKIAGPQTWALARELYLAGLPAPEVASRLNVSVHNLRKKATREKWSRRAHAELVLDVRLPKIGGDRTGGGTAEVASLEPAGSRREVDEPAPEADPALAAATLLRRAAGEALAGRTDHALALLRLAEGLARAAGGGKRSGAASDRYGGDPGIYGVGEGGGFCDDEEEASSEASRARMATLRDRIEGRIAEELERRERHP